MVSFGDKIPGRERPWLRYDRILVEDALLAAPSPLSHDTGDIASAEQLDGCLRAYSPGFHQALLPRENAEVKRKAHIYLHGGFLRYCRKLGGCCASWVGSTPSRKLSYLVF